MRTLICGSRNFNDTEMMRDVMHSLWRKMTPVTGVIHGGAKGADTLAGEWANSLMLPVFVYQACWDLHGTAAGPIRNQQMLVEGKPDIVVAFLTSSLSQSKGTRDMVARSRKANVLTMVIGKDDT